MKISTICPKCYNENINKEKSKHLVSYDIDYFDDRLVKLLCNESHDINIGISNEKFQILFSSSIDTYLSGHTIESTSSAWAAFERFLEFMIRVFTFPHKVGMEDYYINFNDVSGSSERQVGGFLFLYLISVNEPYVFNKRLNTIKDKRNSFIHKGIIPNREDAFYFLKTLYNETLSILNKISKHPELMKSMAQVVNERKPKSIGSTIYTRRVIPDIFYTIDKRDSVSIFDQSFEDVVAEHKERKEQNI
ncbi:hypothetical protein BZ21_760 [Yersinia pseudotuberculosis]|uniref:hypothetical protein n=1 Tax=Yersinia pseudotuberculosis TaxID=633 RepID=UPI0005AD608E|nr:hypothetical protein [Yersinia pseudotuberculosis]AJJ03693.1 hypothetical protein BZ21_760 [Yersinia pseudotuberculosis]CNJ99794.1 Uncharacterised protein [Yersinia pseudotuberculosis]CQH36156.1 Uncharacterised protein [Yersinia pseudotuberculosis]